MSTAAQRAANHANAQLSTGPTTNDGKAKSSLNAVKTALTGQTVLLPTDDAVAYQSHIARLTAQWKAANENEQALVQFIADTEWRLLRIPAIEMGIYAVGRFKLAAQFAEVEDATLRAALIEGEAFSPTSASSATSACRNHVYAATAKRTPPPSARCKPTAGSA
jgi:hypothetical protein